MTNLLKLINQGIWQLVKTSCATSAQEQGKLDAVIGLLTQIAQNTSTETLPPIETFSVQPSTVSLTLAAPLTATTRYLVFRNGQYLTPGVDYSASGQQLTLLYETGDSADSEPDGEIITVEYVKA